MGDMKNAGEKILHMSDEQIHRLQGSSVTCEPSDREAWRHTWARGAAPGWSVCTRGGVAAICPECLPDGEKQPENAIIKRCLPHMYEWIVRRRFENEH